MPPWRQRLLRLTGRRGAAAAPGAPASGGAPGAAAQGGTQPAPGGGQRTDNGQGPLVEQANGEVAARAPQRPANRAGPAGPADDTPPGVAAVEAGAGASEPPATRRAWLFDAAAQRGVPLAAILTVAAVAVAVYLAGLALYRLRQTILLVVVSGFVALLLNPVVVALQRVGRFGLRRRGTAVGVVTVAALLAFVGLATAFGYPLVNAVTHFVTHLNKYVTQAEQGTGWVGHVVRKYHVANWVRTNAPKLESYARSLAKPALSLGKGAFALVVATVVVFMLVLLMLLEGPKLRAGVLRLVDPARRAEVVRVAGAANRAVTGYMLGNLLTSLVAGVVVLVTMLVLGLPFAPLWGLWVALVDFLPLVGGALAGIPVVLFGAIAGSLTDGIVLLVVFVVYTQVENHILNPVVMSRTVRISPLLVLLAVLVGAELGDLVGGLFGGFVGALLAVPLAGTVQVVVREIWQRTGRGA